LAAHTLQPSRTVGATRCHACCELIWGKGVECSACHLLLHQRCSAPFVDALACNGGLARAGTLPCVAQHMLLPETFLTEVACAACGVRIGGVSVHRCQLCRVAVHDRAPCKDVLRRIVCRPWARYSPTTRVDDDDGDDANNAATKADNAEPLPMHNVIHGVCAGTCVVCQRPAASVGVHLVSHCTLCGVIVHDACRGAWDDKRGCTLGPLRDVVLSPHTVSVQDGARFVPHRGALLTFVNRKSGGGQGALLYTALVQAGMSPLQVYDLAQGGPAAGLKLLAHVRGTRILVCGGDGTVAWLLSELDKLFADQPQQEQHGHHHHHHHHHEHHEHHRRSDDADDVRRSHEESSTFDEDKASSSSSSKRRSKRKVKVVRPTRPAVAILPIGTANDLARVSGWGGGYEGEPLLPLLTALATADVRLFDRWAVSVAKVEGDAAAVPPFTFGALEAKTTMNNYMSIGIDAGIALRFHERREASPHLFTSRAVNKAWYGLVGAREQVSGWPAGTKLLKKLLRVVADGVELDLGSNQALVVLNLQSYSGGTDLWGDSSTASADDGKLEIVGFTAPAHALFVRGKMMSASKLGQAKHVRIEWLTPHALPTQVDGEPWSQAPAAFEVRLLNQVPLLVRKGFGAHFFKQAPMSN
jgi:diacylglycerol kinase (ATP)